MEKGGSASNNTRVTAEPFLSIILKPELCLQLGSCWREIEKQDWKLSYKKANYIFSGVHPKQKKKLYPQLLKIAKQNVRNQKNKSKS